MPPHFRVEKLRHRPRHPTQVEAHAVFHRRHIQFFRHVVCICTTRLPLSTFILLGRRAGGRAHAGEQR